MSTTETTVDEAVMEEDVKTISTLAGNIETFAMEYMSPGSEKIEVRELAMIGLAASAVNAKMRMVCADLTGSPIADPTERFCTVSDNSGHHYFIPFAQRDDWNEWLEIDDEDERSWEAPEYATRIDGGTLIFSAPKVV